MPSNNFNVDEVFVYMIFQLVVSWMIVSATKEQKPTAVQYQELYETAKGFTSRIQETYPADISDYARNTLEKLKQICKTNRKEDK